MPRLVSVLALGMLALSACHRPSTVTAPGAGAASAPPPSPAVEAPASEELPPAPPAVPASELAGEHRCGPFDTRKLESKPLALLEERLTVRFLPKSSPGGDRTAGKLEVSSGDARLFVGARETFTRSDPLFARHAAKLAKFGGAYAPVTIPADGTQIVAGAIQRVEPGGDMVALAHGWFEHEGGDVVDVAVFASAGAIHDVGECRRFAEKLLSTVKRGPRLLKYGAPGGVETQVSYAKFRYRLGSDWIQSSSMGIHDFARITFRRRGTFPKGAVVLELGLDSHPGEWTSPGGPDGDRAGKLLGLEVSWHLTKDAESGAIGAWTISKHVDRHDHAVASLFAFSAADRDEAIRFAESVQVGR